MSTWRILSNGPSIAELDELPGIGPIVAVNHAITHPLIEADHWCCHEYGRGIENQLVRKAKGPRLETWVGKGHLHRWSGLQKERALVGLPRLVLVPHPHETNLFRHAFSRHENGWKTTCRWGDRSFFAAIAGCILRGARRIDVFGCDMQGDTHYGGGPAGALIRQRSRAGQHREDCGRHRWKYEREWFEDIVRECGEHDVEVVRKGA